MEYMNSVYRPKIVCLCGSTKFKDEFERVNAEETMKGNIVLSVGFFMHSDQKAITTDQKRCLDSLHLRKIDLADEVIVLNVNGYIGESTSNEISYSFSKGKPVRFLYPGTITFKNPLLLEAKEFTEFGIQ